MIGQTTALKTGETEKHNTLIDKSTKTAKKKKRLITEYELRPLNKDAAAAKSL